MTEFTPSGNPQIDIPALIKYRGNGLSFVELLRFLPYLKGDLIYENQEWNFVFWAGVSQECINTLRNLVNRDVIQFKSTHPLTYFIDGVVPRLPLVKRERKYKKPHWAPMTLSLGKAA